VTASGTVRAAFLCFALCLSLFYSAFAAAAQVAVPPLTARVTDQTATLSSEQKSSLEQTLEAFERSKGSQIAVLIVPTSGDETIEQYALRVVEQWKLGRKKVDDGALLIVAKDDRTLRIEVGYGLEGALNDATAKRIISETIVPRFKQGDFSGGVADGVAQIMKVIDGEPLPAVKESPLGNAGGGVAGFEQAVPVLFMVALVLGGVLRALLGRFFGALAAGGAIALLAWFVIGATALALIAGVIAFFFTLLGGGLGGFGGGMGGRGGGMGGRGGGFGGGGGGFGGGGASGRW